MLQPQPIGSLERQIDKVASQLVRTSRRLDLAYGLPARLALDSIAHSAGERIEFATGSSLNTSAFPLRSFHWPAGCLHDELERAAALLSRQAIKISTQNPGVLPEQVLSRALSSACRVL